MRPPGANAMSLQEFHLTANRQGPYWPSPNTAATRGLPKPRGKKDMLKILGFCMTLDLGCCGHSVIEAQPEDIFKVQLNVSGALANSNAGQRRNLRRPRVGRSLATETWQQIDDLMIWPFCDVTEFVDYVGTFASAGQCRLAIDSWYEGNYGNYGVFLPQAGNLCYLCNIVARGSFSDWTYASMLGSVSWEKHLPTTTSTTTGATTTTLTLPNCDVTDGSANNLAYPCTCGNTTCPGDAPLCLAELSLCQVISDLTTDTMWGNLSLVDMRLLGIDNSTTSATTTTSIPIMTSSTYTSIAVFTSTTTRLE